MANLIEQDDFVKEVKDILNSARKKAYSSVNSAMVEAYWKIGKRIVKEEQLGEQRAVYGEKVIKSLSLELKKRIWKRLFGEGTKKDKAVILNFSNSGLSEYRIELDTL